MANVYVKYYTQQCGGGGGKGVIHNDEFGNILRLPRVYQRGSGIGGVFSTFWKFLQPLLKSGAKVMKKELISTGKEMLTGKPLPDIIRDRTVDVIDAVRDKVVNKVNNMTGSGRKRKRVLKSINSSSKRRRITLGNKKRLLKQPPTRVLDIFS